MELIEKYRQILEEFCRKNHIAKLALFGSALRNDFNPESSDIDFLVEFQPENMPSLFGVARMENELCELLGHKIDLRTKQDINILIRDRVVNNSQTVFSIAC